MEIKELLKQDNLIIMGSHEYPSIEGVQFWGGVGEVVRNVSERLVQSGYQVLVLPRLITEYRTAETFLKVHNGVHILGMETQRYLAGKENEDLYLTYPSYEGNIALDHEYTTWRYLQQNGLKKAIVHVHDWLGAAWARESKRLNFKTVYTVHMSCRRDPEALLVDKRLELEKQAGNCSNPIHFVSFHTLKNCKIYGWNHNKKKIVIPNGVDIKKYYPLEHKTHEEYVLFIGRLVPVKNVPSLILGWSKFNEKYPNVKLQILGAPGASYVDVQQTWKSLPNEQRALAELKLEMVSFEERLERLQNATIFCAPSSKEAFGIVGIEAESCGIPVVVGDVGGFKENALEGVTGVHVNGEDPTSIAEGLELAYLNKEEFGRNGRKLVEQYFDWNRITEKYIKELYGGE